MADVTPALELTGIDMHYGYVRALDQIDFHVANGEVVALARSATRVSGEPNGVLLLDEPTAALGYEQTKQVEALIVRMASQGIACVLVTHNLPLAMEVSTRIVVLNRGRKYADVPTAKTDNDQLVGWITGARPSMFAA